MMLSRMVALNSQAVWAAYAHVLERPFVVEIAEPGEIGSEYDPFKVFNSSLILSTS